MKERRRERKFKLISLRMDRETPERYNIASVKQKEKKNSLDRRERDSRLK